MSYKDDIKDVRWQEKRLEILSRDKWECKTCGANKENTEHLTLNVHHLRYEKGKKIWEYDLCELTTLCDDCHHRLHFPTLTSASVEGDRQSIGKRIINRMRMARLIGSDIWMSELIKDYHELVVVRRQEEAI